MSKFALKYGNNQQSALQAFKRFLDDLFQIFKSATKQLHAFCEEINQIHPTLKFIMAHTMIPNEPDCDKCECEPITSIPFPDTCLSI